MRVRTMTIQEGHMHNINRYPNFHKSGSISGMKQKSLWDECFTCKMRKLYL